VQTINWTFTGTAYDASVGGAQMTLTLADLGIYTPGGVSSGGPGTILSLYLNDGDAIPDFQLQIAGSHPTPEGIVW
jgi:hypothetical protein